MKRLYICAVATIFALLITVSAPVAHASTLDCSSIDGASIYGYDGTSWYMLGAVSNQYDDNSIANEYEAGNEYDPNSIFNSYGDFGSQYSTYSAFNNDASVPPVVMSGNQIVGYLTTNPDTTSAINPYYALDCADDSYSTSDSNYNFGDVVSTPSSSDSSDNTDSYGDNDDTASPDSSYINSYDDSSVSPDSSDDDSYTNVYGDQVQSPYSDDNSDDNSYTNVDGNTVPDPAYSEDGSVPDGATAQCDDGTYSFSQNDSGTCSYHGGVEEWLQ